MRLRRLRASIIRPLTGAMAVMAMSATVTGCGIDRSALEEAMVAPSPSPQAKAVAGTSQTVPFSGSQVIVTAPAGATGLTVTSVGGSGGTNGAGDQSGGLGAVVTATVTLATPNQQFLVWVGGQGGTGATSGGQGSPTEVGGSGSGSGSVASGGGGGATYIQTWDPNTQGGQDLIVAAAGGGAGGSGNQAGTAGGTGGNAGMSPQAGATGSGGQPGAGGPAGTQAGPPMGQDGDQSQDAVAFGAGGGAGFGGGNGGNSSQYGGGGGGGGGLCYVSGLLSNVTIATADAPGNGVVVMRWTTS